MKKNLIRLVTTALLGVMLFSFVGCSSKDKSTDSGDGKVTLTFGIWDKNQQPAMQKLCDAYTAQNPDVKVEIQLTTYKGGEYWTKLEASCNGGTAPDVFWMNGLHVESYVDGGMLESLSGDVGEADFATSDFPETLINLYTLDNKLYAVPKDFDTNALWYNKKIFDAAGVDYPTDDWTWDDMVAAAAKLTDASKGIYGIAAPLDFQTCYYSTINAAGGYILNDDMTAAGYNDPKTQEGIQCWIDLINDGYSPSLPDMTDTSPDALFESNKLGMIWAGSYMTPEYIGNSEISSDINLVEAPSFEGNKGNVINGLGYAVYSQSKNKEEAIKFALWLGSSEAMKIQGETGVVISARNDAHKYFAEANPDINLAAYTNQVDVAKLLPCFTKSSELFDIEANYLKKAYAGEMSLKDACTKINKEVEDLLSSLK